MEGNKVNKRNKKKRCKAKFPALDPSQDLHWTDKHLLAFSATSNFEAAYFFERILDHTMARGTWDDRTDVAMLELGRLRQLAQVGLENRETDTTLLMGFVYTRYIRPMANRYGLTLTECDYDLHAPKSRILVPDLGIHPQ